MGLGTWTRTDTLYGEGYSVRGSSDLAAQLEAAIRRLPAYAPSQASPAPEPAAPAVTPPPPARHITEGSFFIDEDRVIRQCVGGQTAAVVYGGLTLRACGQRTA